MKLDDDQAIAYVKANQTPPKHIIAGRKEARELFALIEGDNFTEELINKIEHIESIEKAVTRKKYSRDVQDLFERVLQPVDNVFNSTGGSKKYEIDNKNILKDFLTKISTLRDNKSIQKYVQENWMPLYHTDPNGVIFMEYTTGETEDVYPTYKSIYRIAAYIPKGQLTEVILFEPKRVIVRGEAGQAISEQRHWRLVDDVMDRTIIQTGESFVISTDPKLTFKHPFGEVPAVINSNIEKITRHPYRLSPIHKSKALSKEFARDQSVKTLYKFLQGFPIHWRYVVQCKTCQGAGKTGNINATPNARKNCPDCDGKGFYMKKDVTDMVTLDAPKHKDSVKLAPDIAGYVSPDLETWGKYSEELRDLENLMMDTHWGTHKEKGAQETATGRFIDLQPVMNRLNKYADVAEYVEMQLSEWIYRFFNPGKLDRVVSIFLGRRYIIESPDIILTKYHEAKKAGSNVTILDRIFNEFLTAKYGSDPEWLRIELLKAEIEPFLHLSIDEVNQIFGVIEARKKALFGQWWHSLELADKKKSAEELTKIFLEWFKQQPALDAPIPPANPNPNPDPNTHHEDGEDVD